MSRLKKRDQQEALKLDKCYEETLERVRPYILSLNVAEDERNLCRVWLQKLCSASSQRSLRNRYLLELCNNLKSGHVSGIFGKPPPNGPLGPLPRFCNHTVRPSSSLSDLSDTSGSIYQEAPRSIMKHRNKIICRTRSNDSTSSTNCDSTIREFPAVRYDDKVTSDKNQLTACTDRIDSLKAAVQKLQIENEGLKRDLSYSRENCDCKENSDNLYSTIDQLTAEITTLRTKLLEVKNMKDLLEKNHQEIVDEYKSTMTKQFDELNERSRESHCRNVELEEKVAEMTSELKKIMDEKEEEIIMMEQSCKEKIENAQLHCETLLAAKDRELLFKNEIINEKDAELASREKLGRDEISLLNDKIHDLEDNVEMKIEIINEKNAELASREILGRDEISLLNDKIHDLEDNLETKIEIINEKNAELASKEKCSRDEILLLNDKIHDLEDKLQTKIEDEGKLQSFLKEQCSTIKEEFMKMRSAMEIAMRTENQSLLDKISALNRIIIKLMKSKEKLNIESENKISNVLKTKDLEIKSLQLQLQEQQSELSTTISTEKQCELDSLVRLLEERYKGLLAATDANAGKQRQNFLRKITFLESQVTCMKNSLVDSDVYV